MLYRLRPPANVTWCDAVSLAQADLDELPWAPATERLFGADLLRIALRHEVASPAGLVLDALRVIEQTYPGTSELAEHWRRLGGRCPD
jgi:hypothetical protein